MKNKLFAIFTLLLCSGFLFSQNNKPVPPVEMKFSTSNMTNDIGALTTVQPKQKEFSAEKKDLLRQLRVARENNNTMAAEQIQNRLHKIDGVVLPSTDQAPQNMALGGPVKQTNGPAPDYGVSQIHNLSIWSNAVATVPAGYPNAGRIFAVTTQYSSGADTIKYYYSDNGGSTWTYFYIVYFNLNWDYLSDDIDLEVVNDGTNIWLWTTAGYHDYGDGKNKAVWVRFNANTGANLYAVQFFYPGYTLAGNNYSCARVTTDNSNYTTASYVYFICSFDSLVSGTTHVFRQKYSVCENPFAATPVINYQQPYQGGFYWSTSGALAGFTLSSDIGYYRDVSGTGNDRIMTVYNSTTAFHSMYLAWSDDYGVTNAGSTSITDANVTYGARIAFNGGPTYRSGMITYTRQFNGTDWDPYYYNTTNGGITAGAWTGGFVDASSNRCRSVDITAIRGGNNLFKSAYAQDNPTAPNAFSSDFNGTTWSTPVSVSNQTLDTVYGKPRAGYTTGADNCLTIWSLGPTGINAYASRLCNTTVGINNNQTPVKFSLSQNYPNPFNPTTNIKFELPKAGIVKLVVYDLLGSVVATLVNENMNPGSYSVDFNASNIASGVYLYKLEANGFTDVKKMMLIK